MRGRVENSIEPEYVASRCCCFSSRASRRFSRSALRQSVEYLRILGMFTLSLLEHLLPHGRFLVGELLAYAILDVGLSYLPNDRE